MDPRLMLTLGLAASAVAAALVVQPLHPGPGDPVAADPVVVDVPAPSAARDVDLVICLDTSGSMDQLLDSARARLWDIVNEVTQREPDARVRVGLVSYGSPVPSAGEGFVVVRSDLTTDLDEVYARAWELTTNGGSEYVGTAMHTALTQLDWSSAPDAAHLLFVAGNESADQGRHLYDVREVRAAAQRAGVHVNALYAGQLHQGERESWGLVATEGGGRFLAFDMEAGTRQVETPHDAQLVELNAELNRTYVPYGAHGRAGLDNQLRQDDNAARAGAGSYASRAITKGGNAYRNEKWDLWDAQQAGQVDLAQLSDRDLPVQMRGMDREARAQHLEAVGKQRQELQRQIASVSAARQGWLEREQPATGGFDRAVVEALADQL